MRQNDEGTYSLYSGDEEIIRGLTEDDVVSFYMEYTDQPTEPSRAGDAAVVSNAEAKPSRASATFAPTCSRDRRPVRRGRQLALLPHADFVKRAMERDPNIRPMTMALLLNQYGVRVHSLNPVRSIMEYCER
ncbi:hypothetical protein [Methylobacterium oxalidis]|uniref:Uncharacterized protein n=1 Tax=Methylobacterium oxalidis TaxID=944322 RepID=A0A512J5Q6_9HYPH|nr:hypothetical protein [Methylobacterium oxalidis]GEP05314.1 hypothetical protein MOX02_33520 [Methylobacterium oxalidis]GLS63547.1 hypothetical protein GCM10007888_19280 [Methylobacterium oxalidis]